MSATKEKTQRKYFTDVCNAPFQQCSVHGVGVVYIGDRGLCLSCGKKSSDSSDSHLNKRINTVIGLLVSGLLRLARYEILLLLKYLTAKNRPKRSNSLAMSNPDNSN